MRRRSRKNAVDGTCGRTRAQGTRKNLSLTVIPAKAAFDRHPREGGDPASFAFSSLSPLSLHPRGRQAVINASGASTDSPRLSTTVPRGILDAKHRGGAEEEEEEE